VNARGRAQHPDRWLIGRTWRRIALYTAALFAVGVVALDLLTVGFVFNAEQRDANRQLNQATNDPDALTNPPVDIVVYKYENGALRWTPGARPEPLDATAIQDPPVDDREVWRDGHEYLVRTYRSGPTTVQIGLDLTRRDRERSRLFMGLTAAGAAGVLLAGGLGALIARRAIAPLGNAIERQQRFVADASHELRTPLTQLHTRAQLLEWELRSDWDPERARADVEHLVRGTRQMGEVVEELLAAAQLRVEPQRYEPVDLRHLANQVAESERPRAAIRQVTVDVVAEGTDVLVVRGVGTSLRRVLSSLVDNALTHAPDGGRITIELAPGDRGFVELRVRDDGVGVDPATAERIFQRFYRGDHGGARRFGLGLALVREVVSAHGGTVTAQETPDCGACFVVRLPAWSG
jgi:two-component system, OmpR family, sensor kinase